MSATAIIDLRIHLLDLETLAALGVDTDTVRCFAHQQVPWRRATDEELHREREYAIRELALLEGDERLSLQVAYLEMRNAAEGELARRGRLREDDGSGAEFAQRVKRAVDLPSYLSDRDIYLRKISDRRWIGLCPFHEDKRPSLSVWPDHFYCFSCNVSGDVFAFVTLHPDGPAQFTDAVLAVAKYAGIDAPKPKETRRKPVRRRRTIGAGDLG